MVPDIYEICVQGQNDRQTENPIFYKVETFLDRLFEVKIYIIPNFLKIVRAVLEIVNICIPTYIYIYMCVCVCVWRCDYCF